MNWDVIYRSTRVEDLHWYPGEPDEILKRIAADHWSPGARVLDIGCGQGTDTLYLASLGYLAVGLDVSRVACEVAWAEAQRLGLKPLFVVGNALELPFVGEQFDAVTDRGCFHHIEVDSRSAFASEVARVLKPHGLYLYRNFSWKSQFNASGPQLLTESVVRQTFQPYFTIERFEEYQALGQGGRSVADMHWGLFRKKAAG